MTGRHLAGIRWESAPEFAPLLSKVLDASAEPVKSMHRRRVTRHRLDGRVYYVKRYFHANIGGFFVQWLLKPPASRREWQLAPQLLAKGLALVPHLAHGEGWSWRGLRETILITEGPEGFADVRSFSALDPERVQHALGAFVRSMHEAGVLHRDLHIGNLLYSPATNSFCLVDVANLVLKPNLGVEERVEDLAKLNRRFPLQPAFYESYKDTGLEERVKQLTAANFRTNLPRYVRRCLRPGLAFAPHRFGNLKWQVRMPLRKTIEPILREPDGFLEREARLLKNGRSSTVGSRDGVVLKRSNPRKRRNIIFDLFRPSRGRRAFLLARHLELVQIASPLPIATADRRRFGFLLCSYFLMEEVPGATRIRAWKGDKGQALRGVAVLLARLHQEGFDHRDLKESNLAFDLEGKPYLLDLDGLRYVKRLTDRRAAANLARLAESIMAKPVPGDTVRITRSDHVRFLRHYCEERGRTDWHWWWKQIASGLGP